MVARQGRAHARGGSSGSRPVLCPSDFELARRSSAQRVRIGGRVVESARGTVVVADALTTVRVTLAGEPHESHEPLEPGELVIVEGRPKGRRLEAARLIARHSAPAPTGTGEFARLAWQGVGSRLAARSRAFEVIRGYFRRRRFVEVDTPIRATTPGLDLHVDAIGAEGGYLITSPEHHMKRLLTGGMPRIFQLVHASRAGEQGDLHEPEFMMLEWYRAFAGVESVMRDTEQIVESVTRALAGRASGTLPDGRRIDLRPPFERLSVREAFRRHAGIEDAVDLAERDEARFFELFVNAVEPALARQPRALFLCGYPLVQASLARASPDDPSIAERFELYAGGVELCNGFGELTDAKEQRSRFERDRRERRRRGLPVYAIDEKLLSALGEGMPPAAGNALGVDRLIALALGARSVAEVMAFPETRR